jgi:hypothetical protein
VPALELTLALRPPPVPVVVEPVVEVSLPPVPVDPGATTVPPQAATPREKATLTWYRMFERMRRS